MTTFWFTAQLMCILCLWGSAVYYWYEYSEVKADRDEWRAIAMRGVTTGEQLLALASEMAAERDEHEPYTGETQSLEGLL